MMKNILTILMVMILIFPSVLKNNEMTAFAAENSHINKVAAAKDYQVDDSYYDENSQKIFDGADLLPESDEKELTEKIVRYAKELKLDIIVVTADDSDVTDTKLYADDFFDDNGHGYEYACGSGVLMFVDMYNREVAISTSGLGRLYLDDYTEEILDEVQPHLSSDEYYEAVDGFLEEVKQKTGYYHEDDEYEEVYEEWYAGNYSDNDDKIAFYEKYDLADDHREKSLFTYLKNPFISAIISIVVAGITVLIMSMQSKTKVTVSSGTYMSAKGLKMNEVLDIYTHTTTSKRKIEKDNDNGGGGSSISSSGQSHGGGSRSF